MNSFIKGSTPQQLCNHINWILWLINTFKFLQISMTETSHNINLIDDALHSLGCFVKTCFWKSFNCVMRSCLKAFNLENSSKLTLAHSSYSFELLMETVLTKISFQNFKPFHQNRCIIGVETGLGLILLLEKFESNFSGFYITLNIENKILHFRKWLKIWGSSLLQFRILTHSTKFISIFTFWT